MSNDGFFSEGDRIQLTDPKGKMYTFTIMPGKEWHTHKGWIVHDDLIGMPEGSVVSTSAGLKFTAFKPLLGDFVLSMPRGATIVYPKDAAMIIGVADVFPGAKVIEAGVGSGALSISLLRAIGPDGELSSFERREDFAEIASENVKTYFNGLPSQWKLTIGSVQDSETEKKYDRVILDMLAPWECVPFAAEVLRPGGVFLAYVATTTQLSSTAEALKEDGNFTEPLSSETIVRDWHHEGLAVRPMQRMIGHTGFLIVSRRMAPGVEVLPRRRRPSKGAYGVAEE
ncbi:MAG: tRNA (adenine-N1)-methyltransferase [Actinobacteria bacterium]|jgi:tRNA (adenine57-N1/adenine58-N1)-methyltransferase catalytic subunit|nr:tRNA (adenine-N1)-methyltransferase [Actinomycetota bacterium]NDA95372.1 tRNA (adenine-N1)-methyltransferase [Actinomycetota bacterium]NDH80988.1 tRNA (adenine-N1)-methyltransferase [Actinomycetota bacterium]NDH99467.1 tRNA (adenine-N1)-methyltransferase [Actinomycetota bacterium]NDI07915.1 tRNA (adenine-N1)-methyltransferase [Actinomycetota bacterium]